MKVRAILKWSLIVIGSIVGIICIGVGIAYLIVGNDLTRTFENTGRTFDVPTDPARATEGERLSRIRGCTGSCHGDSVNGMVFIRLPDGSRIVAQDLALAVQRYSGRELENLIRHGIRPDGTSLIRIMPSSMFYHLSDADLGAIVAYLQSQPAGDPVPESSLGPLARVLLLYVRNLVGTILAAEEVDHLAPRIEPMVESPAEHGRYLALTICSECHGMDLRGAYVGPVRTPTLAIVAAYSGEDFKALMRTGQPIGDREPALMEAIARMRLSYLTDREIDDLHAYLKTLAATAVEP